MKDCEMRSAAGRRYAAHQVLVLALSMLIAAGFYDVTGVLASGPPGTLISIRSDGNGSGNNQSVEPSISADGRFVAFVSDASNLVANDTNGSGRDVFVRDTIAGTTQLVSVNSAGMGSGSDQSYDPQISADGRFIVFTSGAYNLVANDTNQGIDVFVRDLTTGTTQLVSVNSAGTDSGDNISGAPVISADGRFVAFASYAGNLVTNDTNGSSYPDIFVRDMVAGTTRLVSVNNAGTGSGNDQSSAAQISPDGRFVVFRSYASNIAANDHNNAQDIFVRDLSTGTTQLVSVNSAGTDSGNGESHNPALSPNGRFITFFSFASDLVANDSNGFDDVFVRDLVAGTTQLVSVNRSGTGSGNYHSSFSAISADGRYVAFLSDASDLVANDFNGKGDVFVRDMVTNTTTLVSVNQAGVAGGLDQPHAPLISPDGRFVIFVSNARNLSPDDTNYNPDVFVRDMVTGTTTLVSRNNTGTGSGNGSSGYFLPPVISPDARFIAFSSDASNLVGNDTNGSTQDVFEFRLLRPASDYDADGKVDLAIWRPADGNWSVINSSTGTLKTQQWGLGSLGDKPVPADYDGDGKTDLAVFRSTDNSWYILQSSNNTLKAQVWGFATDKLVPADYDGDGKADVAVYRPGDGTWYILQSSNNALRADQWGASEDKPVPADYDGDGRADLAVFRPSEGMWYIYQSATNSFRAQPWGLSTDKPAPADYDGDGRADLAVFRPSEGIWYILKSTDGTYVGPQWGINGDIPLPADYDGDGKADVAVWREALGCWYILKSFDGLVIQQPLGNSGDLPVTFYNPE